MSLAPYQTNTVYTMLSKNKYGDWPNQNSKCSSCKDTFQSHESSSRPLTIFLHTRPSVTGEQSHRQQKEHGVSCSETEKFHENMAHVLCQAWVDVAYMGMYFIPTIVLWSCCCFPCFEAELGWVWGTGFLPKTTMALICHTVPILLCPWVSHTVCNLCHFPLLLRFLYYAQRVSQALYTWWPVDTDSQRYWPTMFEGDFTICGCYNFWKMQIYIF